MKIDDLKLGEPLFAILPVPGTDQYVVVYPDKTYDVMSKKDIKSDFDGVLQLREGAFESIEDLREGIDEVKSFEDETEDDDDEEDLDDAEEELGGRGDFFTSAYKPPQRMQKRIGSFDVNSGE